LKHRDSKVDGIRLIPWSEKNIVVSKLGCYTLNGMKRFLTSLLIVLYLFLGNISNQAKSFNILEHISSEHSADKNASDHHHDHEHTKDENDSSGEHSHTFELSSLNTAWNFERTEFESLKINFPTRELHAIATESHLTQKNFPLFIFRPPIS